MIKHQFQPSAKSCGQTCLAMLLGVPVAQVIADMPDRAATRVGQLCAYLVLRGWTATKLQRIRGLITQPAIIRVVWPGRSTRAIGHWILFADGNLFDPTSPNNLEWMVTGGRLTSYIALAPPERAR